MFKIKKVSQIHDKNEGITILEDKFHSINNATQSKLGLWLDDIEKSETKEWSIDDPERWNNFKNRYMNEFEDKIHIIDEIMEKKKDKVKVTWISVFNRKY
jgi:uncharacterized protein YeaO (DUF488 family)